MAPPRRASRRGGARRPAARFDVRIAIARLWLDRRHGDLGSVRDEVRPLMALAEPSPPLAGSLIRSGRCSLIRSRVIAGLWASQRSSSVTRSASAGTWARRCSPPSRACVPGRRGRDRARRGAARSGRARRRAGQDRGAPTRVNHSPSAACSGGPAALAQRSGPTRRLEADRPTQDTWLVFGASLLEKPIQVLTLETEAASVAELGGWDHARPCPVP